MIAFEEYSSWSARDIARAANAGDIAPEEVLDAAINAIERLNPTLNAVVQVCRDAAEKQIHAGVRKGPLYAVPILLKDLGCPSVQTRSTYGSELFAMAPMWTHDCVFVERLKRAGAIVIGRTNTCEFGVALSTESAYHGPTRNPHNLSKSPGGSSGGSAAAVASGIVPLAHATDGCGSIRVPASHCGIFGLKTTRGRLSFAPDLGESWAGMSVLGCLSRSAADTALLLDAVSGGAPGDPHYSPPVGKLMEELDAPLAPLRIGLISTGAEGTDIHPECRAALSVAVQRLEAMGHTVIPLRQTFDPIKAVDHLMTVWSIQLWSLTAPRYKALGIRPDGWGMEAHSWLFAEHAIRCTAADYADAIRYMHQTTRDLSKSWDNFDLLLTPVAAEPPQAIGVAHEPPANLRAYMIDLFDRFPFTAQFNITGRPAMSVPAHTTADGLPVGVQFASKMGQDGLLIRLAAQWEKLVGVPSAADVQRASSPSSKLSSNLRR